MKCIETNVLPRGSSWDELEKELFTPAEIAECRAKTEILSEMIRAREEDDITQKKLSELSGIKQPVISKMESGNTDPRLSTVLRILAALGKTIKVVPLEEQ